MFWHRSGGQLPDQPTGGRRGTGTDIARLKHAGLPTTIDHDPPGGEQVTRALPYLSKLNQTDSIRSVRCLAF
jgi:hypothetical protein